MNLENNNLSSFSGLTSLVNLRVNFMCATMVNVSKNFMLCVFACVFFTEGVWWSGGGGGGG